ncbi:putative short-chain dehydrogenase [Ilyonectria robusta]|uniref:putative short-chain dehydrogenase n=1 Tax=Ilyonectria robusta TaxID=1079257 RepID=UPI001E8D4063|nr:putative short-chain dehydrogenase [Ilyonectria robusta]KAH8658592.1 putative short-chain dehydrogenase [Ilyonectria robusta]
MAHDALSLEGKTVGYGSGRETGIGAAIARAWARNGASVAIHYVSEDSKARAEKVAINISTEFGTKATVIQGGVENDDTAESMVKQILEPFDVDHIGILVHNAEAARNTPLLEVKAEQLEYEYAVNVLGVIYMIQAVVGVGRMPQGGRIINIGSISSKILVPPPLGKTSGITVNTIAPGPVPTDLSTPLLVASDGSATALQISMSEQKRAANRLGTVEDIADATLLLVSEKSRWITAQFISVSGGITGTM